MNEIICPNCHQLIRWFRSNNGLTLCPKCNYSPTVNNTILLGTSSNQPTIRPNIPNKLNETFGFTINNK